jgi:DNA-binding response OmpR family regulator
MARILVIDDDPTIRSLCTLALTNSGHEVVTAPDGRDGLSLLGRNAFDLVVTDLVMPDQEGISTIRSIRGMARDLPILAISGSAGGEARGVDYLKLALSLGAQAGLRKPFSPRQLTGAVEALLRDGPPPAGA